jgi:hypothetical protein
MGEEIVRLQNDRAFLDSVLDKGRRETGEIAHVTLREVHTAMCL